MFEKYRNKIGKAFLINSISAVVVFISDSPTIVIFHFDTLEHKEIDYDKDEVRSLDYCSAKDTFIFGHQSGKLSFATYSQRTFMKNA